MRPLPTAPLLGIIHAFEGKDGSFEMRRAQDPAGNWEIGWSHKLSGPDDPLWDRMIGTDAEADALAISDLNGAAANVCAILGPAADKLSDGQYAALVDFTYNEGAGRFAGATLCHFVKIGAYASVPAELMKWVYGRINGVETKLAGLVRRRSAEVQVWNS